MNLLDRSHVKTEKGISYFDIPEMAELGWVRHAFLTRRGGVSPSPYDSLNLSDKNGDQKELVASNRNLVATTFCFEPGRLVLLDQMQKDQILLVREPIHTLPAPLQYDAMMTDSPNVFLGILTADCLPILVVDRGRKIIAAIHAGRQGTSLQITSNVLKTMKTDLGCSTRDLLIGIGPSIGSCCYEIDEKVFHPEWKPFSTEKGRGKWMVDLVQVNIALLKNEGVKEEQIFRINVCTRCCSDLFFSYRGEGRTGRQLSFIGILE